MINGVYSRTYVQYLQNMPQGKGDFVIIYALIDGSTTQQNVYMKRFSVRIYEFF